MDGHWVVVHNKLILAIFYLTPDQFKRVVECEKKDINPFAGLFSLDESQKPVAIHVSGSNNVFASNTVTNMYSFGITPGGSIIILDHIQIGKDQDGKNIEYKVDLSFVLGLRENETWDAIATRLLQLFDTLLFLKQI
jgi:hypothetical protein